MQTRSWKPKYIRLTVTDMQDDARRVELMKQHGLDPSKRYLTRTTNKKEYLLVQWVEGRNG